MARPKEFEPVAALTAAVDVFWGHGFDRTSLDDLMAAMHVGRQSLYDTFGDERELADKDIARLVKTNQAEVEALFEGALRKAQQAGELAAAKDPAALARFFMVTIQGMRATARARSDRAALAQVANLALSMLD